MKYSPPEGGVLLSVLVGEEDDMALEVELGGALEEMVVLTSEPVERVDDISELDSIDDVSVSVSISVFISGRTVLKVDFQYQLPIHFRCRIKYTYLDSAAPSSKILVLFAITVVTTPSPLVITLVTSTTTPVKSPPSSLTFAIIALIPKTSPTISASKKVPPPPATI